MELAPVDSTGAAGFLGRGSHFSPECPRETSGSPTTLGPPLPSRRGFRSEHRASNYGSMDSPSEGHRSRFQLSRLRSRNDGLPRWVSARIAGRRAVPFDGIDDLAVAAFLALHMNGNHGMEGRDDQPQTEHAP